MLQNIKGNFNRKVWVIMAIAILVDWLLALIGAGTGLPIVSFIGILLVSALAGPWAGALTGLLSTMFTSSFSFLFYPDYRAGLAGSFFGWCLVYVFIGYFAGKLSQWDYFKFWWTSILAGFITAISTITLLLVSSLLGAKPYDFSSIFSFTYFVLPMTISALLVFFVLKSSINRFFNGLPHPDYVQIENNTNDPKLNSDERLVPKSNPTMAQKAIGLTVLVIVIFSIIFVIWFALGISAAVN